MGKYISVDVINSVITACADDSNIKNEMLDIVKNTPKSDVIPVSFMLEYAVKHDPVCEGNIKTMIERYKRGIAMYE